MAKNIEIVSLEELYNQDPPIDVETKISSGDVDIDIRRCGVRYSFEYNSHTLFGPDWYKRVFEGIKVPYVETRLVFDFLSDMNNKGDVSKLVNVNLDNIKGNIKRKTSHWHFRGETLEELNLVEYYTQRRMLFTHRDHYFIRTVGSFQTNMCDEEINRVSQFGQMQIQQIIDLVKKQYRTDNPLRIGKELLNRANGHFVSDIFIPYWNFGITN